VFTYCTCIPSRSATSWGRTDERDVGNRGSLLQTNKFRSPTRCAICLPPGIEFEQKSDATRRLKNNVMNPYQYRTHRFRPYLSLSVTLGIGLPNRILFYCLVCIMLASIWPATNPVCFSQRFLSLSRSCSNITLWFPSCVYSTAFKTLPLTA